MGIIIGIVVTVICAVALFIMLYSIMHEEKKVEAKQIQAADDLHAYVVSEIKRKMPKMTHANWAWAIKTETTNGERQIAIFAKHIFKDEENLVICSLTESVKYKGAKENIPLVEYARGDAEQIKWVADLILVDKVIDSCRSYLVKNRPDDDDEPTYEIL